MGKRQPEFFVTSAVAPKVERRRSKIGFTEVKRVSSTIEMPTFCKYMAPMIDVSQSQIYSSETNGLQTLFSTIYWRTAQFFFGDFISFMP